MAAGTHIRTFRTRTSSVADISERYAMSNSLGRLAAASQCKATPIAASVQYFDVGSSLRPSHRCQHQQTKKRDRADEKAYKAGMSSTNNSPPGAQLVLQYIV